MRQKTIRELKEILSKNDLNSEFLNELRKDKRIGVQQLLNRYEKQHQKQTQLEEEYQQMQKIESKLKKDGFNFIAGVDEAGRGPLAGPVVAASVILPNEFKLLGLTDSKQLDKHKRTYFYERIKKEAISYHISFINNNIIDKINIFEATIRAMKESINGLTKQADYVLIDAVKLEGLTPPTQSIIKGDQKSITIAAASILAKVTRDRYMEELHKLFPMYDFYKNKGYGTKQHVEKLTEYGISPYHRKSFSPVKSVMNR